MTPTVNILTIFGIVWQTDTGSRLLIFDLTLTSPMTLTVNILTIFGIAWQTEKLSTLLTLHLMMSSPITVNILTTLGIVWQTDTVSWLLIFYLTMTFPMTLNILTTLGTALQTDSVTTNGLSLTYSNFPMTLTWTFSSPKAQYDRLTQCHDYWPWVWRWALPLQWTFLTHPEGCRLQQNPQIYHGRKTISYRDIFIYIYIYTLSFSSASNHAIICFVISAWALTAGLKEHITMIIIKGFYCANSCPKTVLREYIHAHMGMYTIHNLPSL